MTRGVVSAVTLVHTADKTRQFCFVFSCLVGVNRIGDKSTLSTTKNFETVLSSLEMQFGLHKTVLTCRHYSVHATDKTRPNSLVLSVNKALHETSGSFIDKCDSSAWLADQLAPVPAWNRTTAALNRTLQLTECHRRAGVAGPAAGMMRMSQSILPHQHRASTQLICNCSRLVESQTCQELSHVWESSLRTYIQVIDESTDCCIFTVPNISEKCVVEFRRWFCQLIFKIISPWKKITICAEFSLKSSVLYLKTLADCRDICKYFGVYQIHIIQ